jgi:O-antigen ligase
MERYLKFIFLFFVSDIFLFEGLGINNGRETAFYLILLMPFFLFIPQFISDFGKKILFPVRFTAIFSLFMIFSLVSSVFSVNLQNSFQNLFLYIALFLIFIFVFNHKELVKNSVLHLIFVLSFIFSIFSLFINFFVGPNSIFSIPIDLAGQGYQFVYSVGAHNHLGDFLLLPLTFLMFRLSGGKSKLENLLLFLFFIPYFIFSYSRSAYLDLFIVTLFFIYYSLRSKVSLKKNFIFYVSGFIFVVVLSVFIFAVPSNTGKPAFLNSLNTTLQQKYDLSPGKMFFANRNFYATQGLLSLANKPLFGVGSGNFEYASQRYMNNPLEYAPTTHNLFFDVFVENGVFAGIVFLTLFLLILSNVKVQLGRKENQILNTNNVLFIFLFLVVLLNFQTDYTFLIRSFFLLFFILIGLIYYEKQTIELNFFVPVFSLILFLIFNLAIFSNIAISKGNYLLAFYSYPLNKEAYAPLVNSQLIINHKPSAISYLDYYVKLFNGDTDVLNYAGNVYYVYVGQKEALTFYEKAFDAYNFMDPELINRIYNVKLNIQGQGKAKEFADKYFLRLSKAGSTSQLYGKIYYQYRLAALKVCKTIYGGGCPYAL